MLFVFLRIDNRCRSSNFDLHNPQCPICQVSLTGQEMITHVQHELDTIQRRQAKLKREQQVNYSLSKKKQRNHYFFIRFFRIITIITSIKHSKLVTKYDELSLFYLNFTFFSLSRHFFEFVLVVNNVWMVRLLCFLSFDFHYQQLFSS